MTVVPLQPVKGRPGRNMNLLRYFSQDLKAGLHALESTDAIEEHYDGSMNIASIEATTSVGTIANIERYGFSIWRETIAEDVASRMAASAMESDSDTAEVLELAEEVLDKILLSVDASVDESVDEALAGRGDVGLGSARPDEVEHSVGVVAPVDDDMAALEAGQQLGGGLQIVGLVGGQHEAHR